VSPPELSLSEEPPARVSGAEVLALPVLAGGEDGSADGVTLGPGAAELLDRSELDLFAVLEHARATGKAGEVTALPVAGASSLADGDGDGDRDGDVDSDLRLVLLVGVGSGTPKELRRAGAAIARRTKDLDTVATSVPAVGDDAGLRAFVEVRCSARSSTTCAPAGPRPGRYAGS
jgi:leucyl aminopeptidase